MYGAIEAGGTKFVCAAVDEEMNILDQITVATLEPKQTMKEVIEFFKKNPVKAIGIGAFGPIEISPTKENYGQILNTPKLAWRWFNMYKELSAALNIPIKIDTDVNAAGLGEYKEGHGVGKRSVLYITIGTGVGAGFVLEGETLFGLTHPEMGHILIRQKEDDVFKGNCPTHNNCLEGLVSGPAIEARLGIKGHELGEDHVIWDHVADYIGQALMTYNLILSPEIILIGGGVAQQAHLFPKIRAAFKKHMNGYIDHEIIKGDLEEYIQYPKLGQKAGLIGAIYLAKEIAQQS
ncbi:MAG: fructokinase [Firmicutes bacterium HGW-Firmicutes-2]|jgi:fructokinase|nr:MAG: fructokinase [Firmicutes bacterium HGW-Firmicutes-2]